MAKRYTLLSKAKEEGAKRLLENRQATTTRGGGDGLNQVKVATKHRRLGWGRVDGRYQQPVDRKGAQGETPPRDRCDRIR